jgi:hypothetical protein
MGNGSFWPARRVLSSALVAGFVAGGAMVWNSSQAAFAGKASNGVDSWSAGTVTLADNDSSAALFTASGLKPGNTGSTCITVTYGGSANGTVKLYVAPADLTGSLGQYINLTVDQGTASTFGPSCTGFTSGGTVYSGTLAGFAAASTSFSSGAGSWPVAGGSGAAKGYRFTWSLQDNKNAQGTSAGARFTWEARG